MGVCRVTQIPDNSSEQHALQRLLFATTATRLPAAQFFTNRIHTSLKLLMTADESPVAITMSTVDHQLQLIHQAVDDVQDTALCQAVWEGLMSATHHQGEQVTVCLALGVLSKMLYTVQQL